MVVAITFLVTTVLMIGVVFTMGEDGLTSFKGLTEVWPDLEERWQAGIDTRFSGPTDLQVKATSTTFQIVLSNQGETSLEQFSKWDVVMEIQENPGLDIAFLTYSTTTPPADGRWSVQGVYLNAASSTAEVIDPGVFNPGEEMIVEVNPQASMVTSTYDRVTFAAPNGVTAKVIFEVVP